MGLKNIIKISLVCFSLLFCIVGHAHHVLGRPSYSLNEDSNTPPSMAVETQLGDYFITYMVFPAFPRPNEPGRVNLYATRIDDGTTFDGKMAFSVRNDSWFGNNDEAESLGVQQIDDGVYRQGFTFRQKGSYIIRASFEANGEPYEIDFPLQVGNVSPIGPIGATVGLLFMLLVGINLLQRKRIARSKIQRGQ